MLLLGCVIAPACLVLTFLPKHDGAEEEMPLATFWMP